MSSKTVVTPAQTGSIESESTNQCPECNGQIINGPNDSHCEDCGLIVEDEEIDYGPEWRSYSDGEEGRVRAGGTLTETLHDRGLFTKIGKGTDGYGSQIAGKKRQKLSRLRRRHGRARFQSKAERNLAHGFGEIRRIAGTLGLSEHIKEQSCSLFRTAQNEDLLKGRSIEGMAAASVYGACRCNGRSRTLTEIVEVARVDQSRVRRSYRKMNTELGLPAKPVCPSDFIPRLISELGTTNRVRQRAQELAETAEDEQITVGVGPTGFAAACVYKAGHEQGKIFTQQEVAEAINTTTVTLQEHKKALERMES